MTDAEELIAFKQWKKDWRDQFSPEMSDFALFQVYRTMDLDCRLEFLEESKTSGLYQGEENENKKVL